MDSDTLEKHLREATPSWQQDGLGVRGPLPTVSFADEARVIRSPSPKVESSFKRPPFPDRSTEDTTAKNIESATKVIFSFQLEDKTGDKVNKVLIRDGEVNGTLPDGMGDDNYILTVSGDGDEIYIIVTYDPSTLNQTSVTIGTGSGHPVNTLGSFVVVIGYVNITDKGVLTPHNTQCGDVNYNLIYGSFNGAPAIIPVLTAATWTAVPI